MTNPPPVGADVGAHGAPRPSKEHSHRPSLGAPGTPRHPGMRVVLPRRKWGQETPRDGIFEKSVLKLFLSKAEFAISKQMNEQVKQARSHGHLVLRKGI